MSSAQPLRWRGPFRTRRLVFLVLWTLMVLYPNPLLLLRAAQHAWSPPIAPEAVQQLAVRLPDDPQAVERYVEQYLVRYEVPWQTYGVPWYFPNVDEVLARGVGDCQAQAIVLASVLRAKGIPARLVGSLDHLWVEYSGKQSNAYENASIALAAQSADGSYALRWPEWNLRESWAIERAYFWDAMPWPRRALLLAGWAVLLLAAPVSRRIARRSPGQQPGSRRAVRVKVAVHE